MIFAGSLSASANDLKLKFDRPADYFQETFFGKRGDNNDNGK